MPQLTPHSSAAVGGGSVRKDLASLTADIGESQERMLLAQPPVALVASVGSQVRWGNDSNYIRIQPSESTSSIYQMSSLQCFTC